MLRRKFGLMTAALCAFSLLLAGCAPPPDVRETRQQREDRRNKEKRVDQYIERNYLSGGGGEGGGEGGGY